ncbi:hypothetical protein [Halolamina salina]|uniref:CR-type domain-containing protein n=1 Tax=Halolamina salina TaxID=1220023 RepID=A0ABD6B3I1_9EURY
MSTDQTTDDGGAPDDDGIDIAFEAGGGLSDEAVAEEMIAEFSESWKVVDDLDGEAEIQNFEEWDVHKNIVRDLEVTEDVEELVVPPSKAPSEGGEYVRAAERYEAAPAEFEEKTVDFVDFGGARVETCTTCSGSGDVTCPKCSGTRKMSCPTCSGSGRESCSACSGSGTLRCQTCGGNGSVGSGDDARQCRDCGGAGKLTCRDCNGSGDFRCSNCGGSTEVVCDRCGGSATVTCSTCEGEREVYRTTQGTLEFEPDEGYNLDDDRGAKFRWFRHKTGDRVDIETVADGVPADPDDDEPTVYREEVETRAIRTRKVSYEYDGDSYELFDVGGSLHADSYPKSAARKVVPFVALALVIALAAGGYYYFAVM